MADCIFCKIVAKEMNSKIVYEDEKIMAIEDINPVAPVHILIIPKKHIASLDAVTDEDLELMGHIQLTASKLAKKLGLNQNGYRLVNNCGSWGGQTVFHIHYHLLGGRAFAWPPG
ncbi:histidine triad (HIT) family protein [Thermosyntropha lipolytica DSM 11003]|uniref:Histidine triad (HIT) family protein n=1 Tax=Thermosyntropha lipolytica DSM 11003 TaxID=1123382 RepID=A0A1M5N8A4_9FIRM|nr:histidine triad nucleotide-binding protein [Thermosyntropha lipolytica]SHG85672.1 histidine triad (HIT) family protein [Thermosyntropha lipolytica DSM 11003]